MPKFDEIDAQIREKRLAQWLTVSGPRVGDFVIRPSGEVHRITVDHNYGGGHSNRMQASEYGSFYFGGSHMSFSGGCGPSFAAADLQDTGETRDGSCWFFHHGAAEAHNGVETTVPCRVYKLLARS